MPHVSGQHIYRLAAYPKEISLRNGTTVSVRPMVPQDEQALLQFFLGISDEDRFYLKEDVTSPKVIHAWMDYLDYNRALPLLALANGRIVSDATLHRKRAGARRHVGEVRIVVAVDYRDKGLGTVMLRELIEIAHDAGLERLVFEAAEEAQAKAIEAAEHLGFIRQAVLPNHVKDMQGKPQDLAILEMPLGKWHEWWEF